MIITCPNLDWVARRWVESKDSSEGDYVLKMIFGSQEHEGMFHRSGYNEQRLAALLGAHGFESEFMYTPYPKRTTPSLLVIARKAESC